MFYLYRSSPEIEIDISIALYCLSVSLEKTSARDGDVVCIVFLVSIHRVLTMTRIKMSNLTEGILPKRKTDRDDIQASINFIIYFGTSTHGKLSEKKVTERSYNHSHKRPSFQTFQDINSNFILSCCNAKRELTG